MENSWGWQRDRAKKSPGIHSSVIPCEKKLVQSLKKKNRKLSLVIKVGQGYNTTFDFQYSPHMEISIRFVLKKTRNTKQQIQGSNFNCHHVLSTKSAVDNVVGVSNPSEHIFHGWSWAQLEPQIHLACTRSLILTADTFDWLDFFMHVLVARGVS